MGLVFTAGAATGVPKSRRLLHESRWLGSLRPRIVDLYLLAVAAATMVNGFLVARKPHDWIVPDWLINYQGGFVRRGLPGELALLLGRVTHLSPILLVVTCYLSLYAALMLIFRQLVLRSSRNYWVICLLVSPATLSFQVLHLEAGYRKELIYLIILSVLLLVASYKKVPDRWLCAYLTAGVTVGVLSHELIVFYLPYLFAGVWLVGRTFQRALMTSVLPAAMALILALACAHHLGSARAAAGICASLGHQYSPATGNDICAGGPIAYLAKAPSEARHETLAAVVSFGYLRLYPVFGLLALIPVFGEAVYLYRGNRKHELMVIASCAAASGLASLVLFLYAIDWGRWIYIHIVSLTLLLLFVDGATPSLATGQSSRAPARSRRIAAAASLVLYASCWALPNIVNAEPVRMGYVGRVQEIIHAAYLRYETHVHRRSNRSTES